MLNRLKNSEIFPYFKQELQFNTQRLQWVDLVSLSRLLKSEPMADEVLQKMLYGDQNEPCFSGFTEKRIRSWIDLLGDAKLQVERDANGERSASLLSPKIDAQKLKHLEQKLARVQFKENKKRFRKKIREWACRVREPIRFSHLPAKLRLNLGAGDENYEGMIKVDWAGSQHVFDDIVSLKKIKNGSVDEIYSNHVLEHIPVFLLDQTLARWAQVLKPGGTLKLRMPDAKQAVLRLGESWTEISEAEVQKLGFPNYLAREREGGGVVTEEMAIQFIYGWSDVMPGFWDLSNQHKSLWTPELARLRLLKCGMDVTLAANCGSLQTVVLATKPK